MLICAHTRDRVTWYCCIRSIENRAALHCHIKYVCVHHGAFGQMNGDVANTSGDRIANINCTYYDFEKLIMLSATGKNKNSKINMSILSSIPLFMASFHNLYWMSVYLSICFVLLFIFCARWKKEREKKIKNRSNKIKRVRAIAFANAHTSSSVPH